MNGADVDAQEDLAVESAVLHDAVLIVRQLGEAGIFLRPDIKIRRPAWCCASGSARQVETFGAGESCVWVAGSRERTAVRWDRCGA